MKTRQLVVVAAGLLSISIGCNRTPPESERKPAAAAQRTPAPPPQAPSRAQETPGSAPQSPLGSLGAAAAGGRSTAGAPAAQPPQAPSSSTSQPAPTTPPAAAMTPPSPAASSTIPPPLARATPVGKPHTDDLAALEMGGRVEWAGSRDIGDYARIKLLDSNPATLWTLTGTNFPVEVTVSFLNHDEALVSGVTVTLPARAPIPIYDNKPNDVAWAKDVEIWTSMESAKSGFHQSASATLPQESGGHDIRFPAPVEAKYVKLVIKSNYGSPLTAMVADFAVREGQAPGYVPFLKRHADLASLLTTGAMPTAGAGAAPVSNTDAKSAELCAKPSQGDVHPTAPESRNVLIVSKEAESMYGPFDYRINQPKSPDVRYFPSDPGDGRVDSSIFERANFWAVPPDAAAPGPLVASGGIDTVVLAQICDIKTSVSDAFKRALVSWVGAGHKLIIQDADGCGPFREPDYTFLPFPFATSNPGAQGAASAMRLVENSALASTDPTDPAFLDLDSWTQKRNGNTNNDFGDSNTVVKYDPRWCGAMVGTNVKGANGFVVVYAHYGAGLIIYDGLDRDQFPNIAYRQWVARQLLVPFAPDALPCSTHLSPFVVTTDSPLVMRDVLPGQTYTYPISVLPVQPGYTGSVRLTLDAPSALGDLHARIDPETVPLSAGDAKAMLTVTMPAKLPEPWNMAVRGAAAGGSATLCLAAKERKTGTLHVTADLGPQPAAPQTRKNLLIILDLSGSMNLPLGRSTRIGTARQVLRDVLNRLPDDFRVGLRLYGHRYGSRQKETCTDSELRIPVQPLDRNAILKTIDTTRPRGETPLVYSVLQAIGDLKAAGGGSVALITDGEESCGGDFAAAERAIKASGLDFRLNIVGFTLTGQQARQQLGALTASTGGAFYAAADGPELTRALVAATIDRFPYTVYDASGAVIARGEAGDRGQELTAGTYRLVVQAGDDRLTMDQVVVAVAGSVGLRVTRKDGAFTLGR